MHSIAEFVTHSETDTSGHGFKVRSSKSFYVIHRKSRKRIFTVVVDAPRGSVLNTRKEFQFAFHGWEECIGKVDAFS